MKTHEEMTKNVFERIHAYEEEKRTRRTKVAMTALPVCAVAAIGVGLWSLGVFRSDDGLLVNHSANSGAAPAVTEVAAETEQTAPQTVMQTTAEPSVTVTESAASVSESVQTVRPERWCMVGESEQNGVVSTSTSWGQNVPVLTTTTTMPQQIHLPNIVFPPDCTDSAVTYEPDYTIVYDYGDHMVRSIAPPRPYDILISEPLFEAIAHYGENAQYHYLVTVEYFDSDGKIVHFTAEELEAEANRLADLVGYVGTAVGTVNDNPPHLVLNAPMEQIQAFPGKEGYGSFLHLRDEADYLILE